MKRWELLEAWLFEIHTFGGVFTNYDVADGLGITPRQATHYIQAYLAAQRGAADTLYVIYREGRTKRAVWRVGIRTADARALSHTYFDDVKVKFQRAVEPDLIRIGELNPRARRRCEQIVEAVSTSAMTMLRVAVGLSDDDDDDDPPAGAAAA